METITFELATMHNEITHVVNVYNYNVNNETNKTFKNKIKIKISKIKEKDLIGLLN